MSFDNDENGIRTDAEGYLVDPVDWNEAVANQLAEREQNPCAWINADYAR